MNVASHSPGCCNPHRATPSIDDRAGQTLLSVSYWTTVLLSVLLDFASWRFCCTVQNLFVCLLVRYSRASHFNVELYKICQENCQEEKFLTPKGLTQSCLKGVTYSSGSLLSLLVLSKLRWWCNSVSPICGYNFHVYSLCPDSCLHDDSGKLIGNASLIEHKGEGSRRWLD